jgi:hypothetical protein
MKYLDRGGGPRRQDFLLPRRYGLRASPPEYLEMFCNGGVGNTNGVNGNINWVQPAPSATVPSVAQGKQYAAKLGALSKR